MAFYTALLGWKPGTDEGSQNQCEIGDIGDIIIRRGGGNRGAAAGTTPPARRAAMGHIAFGITPFDPDQVKAELDKRGLTARVDTGGRGDIHTANVQELPHDHAERIRPADQRGDPRHSQRVDLVGGLKLMRLKTR